MLIKSSQRSVVFFTLLITITIINNKTIVINNRIVMFFDMYRLLICDEENAKSNS